jgi:hypothetical protein
MLTDLTLFDLFTLSFVQLVVSTVLVLTPARNLDTRLRWTGSRFTEVVLGTLGAAAIAAVSCFLTAVLWGLPLKGVESAAYLLVIFSVIVIARPDCSVIGKIFYASYAAAGFTFLGFAAFIAMNSTRSIAETLTASLLIVLDLGAFLVWNSNISYVSDVMARTRRTRPFPVPDPTYQPMVSVHIPAYNEPPEILIATIKAVEAMDYPNFEIVVLDNNTPDEAVWGPVAEYCRDRPKVTFIHVAPLTAPATWRCASTPTLTPKSSRWSTLMTSSSRTTCARPRRISATSGSASFRPAKATGTTKAARITPPASTPTKASTSR